MFFPVYFDMRLQFSKQPLEARSQLEEMGFELFKQRGISKKKFKTGTKWVLDRPVEVYRKPVGQEYIHIVIFYGIKMVCPNGYKQTCFGTQGGLVGFKTAFLGELPYVVETIYATKSKTFNPLSYTAELFHNRISSWVTLRDLTREDLSQTFIYWRRMHGYLSDCIRVNPKSDISIKRAMEDTKLKTRVRYNLSRE